MIGPPDAENGADAVWLELARAHLAAGRTLVAQVSGLSMWPLVKPGQRVVIAPDRHVKVGDLALVVLGRALVLHRVVSIGPDTITTKGDAVARPDPQIAASDVLGRVDGGRSGPLIAGLSRVGGAPLASLSRRLRVALCGRL